MEAPYGVGWSQKVGREGGRAVSWEWEPRLAAPCSHVLGRNSEESKDSKVEPVLPGLYKDIFGKV